MASAEDQIRNLLHRYAEIVDTGQFEELDVLFAHARLRFAVGSHEPASEMPKGEVGPSYRRGIILYADGTPRTRHIVTNSIIEVDDDAGTATSRSYITTLQSPLPGDPIELIATAAYHDTFERVDGHWRFRERIIRQTSTDGITRDFIGDMSRHVRTQDA